MGPCILLKDELDYRVKKDLCVLNEDFILEASCLEILTLNTLVISIYRVPDLAEFRAFINKLQALLKILTKVSKISNIYIAADFHTNTWTIADSYSLKRTFSLSLSDRPVWL